VSDPVTSHRTWVGPRNNIHFGDNERHHVVPVELFKKERRQKLPSGGYKWAPNGSQHSLFGRLYSATDSSQQARDAFFAIFNPANMKTNGISLYVEFCDVPVERWLLGDGGLSMPTSRSFAPGLVTRSSGSGHKLVSQQLHCLEMGPPASAKAASLRLAPR